MSLSVSNILQKNYITSGENFKNSTPPPACHTHVCQPVAALSTAPQKLNLSLQYPFGLQPVDSFKLTKKELSDDEQKKFDEIRRKLSPEKTKELDNLRSCGILTNKKSNDKSTTLDNLYKILKTERAEGLDNIEIIGETLGHLSNPYLISQKSDNSITNYLEAFFSPKTPIYGKRDSSTCTAACIEFDLASLEPAEFTRFVEGLTSKEMKVEKVIDTDNLADKTLDAIWLLNTFDIPREEKDFDKIKLTLQPDENALLKVRLNSKMPAVIKQRNNIDTLMQSTFMHIGSQQSYNSLTDKRGGKFHVTERGLIEFEKTFVESIVRNKNIISVNYQRINEYGEIAGYEADFATIKQQLLDTLALKENVILGVTKKNRSGKLKGHEIVVTGSRTDTNGKTEFLCFNSDIDKTNPVAYSEDYLLPRIHHAGIPKEIVLKTMVFQDGWVMGLENYHNKKSSSPPPAATAHAVSHRGYAV